jgi:hypothetical protein
MSELAKALVKAQGHIKGAVKDASNPHFKAKYADLASVWDACRKPLTDNGLSVVQFTTINTEGTIPLLVTRLLHTSGESIDGVTPLIMVKQDMQALGSAITYARRYGLAAMVGVAPEDDDGNAASEPTTRAQASVRPPSPEAPDGYEEWLADLESTADNGTEALKATWDRSRPELRFHLTATNQAMWEAIKKRSAQFGRAQVSA